MTTRKPATKLPTFTPVPRKCQRHDGWTPERQRPFIERLADYGSVRAAANAAGMTPESAYYLRRQPGAEQFRKAWAAALDLGIERIEDVAMDRALNGIEVPVYSYGKLVGTRRVYNDRLLMFMLRNRAPERFAEGRARGLNALDKAMLARLKKEWRKEWEREQGALQLQRECETIASINAKMDAQREREEAAARLEAERGPRLTPEEEEARDEAEFEAMLADIRAQAEAAGVGKARKVEKDEGPRVRRLKDDGW